MTRINIRDYLHFKEDECRHINRMSQEEKDEMLEAFLLYDTDRNGLISTKELGNVIRAIGQVITVQEETDIIAQYAHEKCYEIDFITFYKFMRAWRKEFDADYELRESFRRFDKEERGYVNKDDLKLMLLTLGEPLTEKEVNDWLEDSKQYTKGTKLYYDDFVTYMLSK